MDPSKSSQFALPISSLRHLVSCAIVSPLTENVYLML